MKIGFYHREKQPKQKSLHSTVPFTAGKIPNVNDACSNNTYGPSGPFEEHGPSELIGELSAQ